MKFIVVDDMSTMRKIIKKALSGIGDHQILEAADGKEALASIVNEYKKGAPIDFIISDWNMPNVTGIQLLQKVKETDIFRETPFLMVTAESEMDNVKKAVAGGVSGFIIKPFTVDQVQAKVKSIMTQMGKKAA